MVLPGYTIPNEADAFNTNQAKVFDGDVSILAEGFGQTGVLSGCAVTAQGTPNMTVAVAEGVVAIAGVPVNVTAGNVTITTADSSNPRLDLISVDTAGTKAVVTGAPAQYPVYPAVPASRTILAAVYVPAADTTINSNQITDKRVLLPVALPGRLLDSQRNTVAYTIPTTATSYATSFEVPGLTVGWTHNITSVEVTFEGVVQFKGVSQASGQICGILLYIADMSLTGNTAYDVYSNVEILYQILSTATTRFLAVPFKVQCEVTAAPGTAMSLQGRAYLSTSTPGARDTWDAKLIAGSGLGTTRIEAREMR